MVLLDLNICLKVFRCFIKGGGSGFIEHFLIAFQPQEIVRFFLYDLLRNPFLTPHRINRDEATVYLQ